MLADSKKCLIIVGKMGHGKSSFSKTLAKKSYKNQIICSSNGKNVTQQCHLYEVDSQIKAKLGFKFQEQLYIMDTPGIQSQERSHVIREMIAEKIRTEKIEVMAIIYIFNLAAGRQFDNQDRSIYVQFHKLFPIQKERKDNLSFFVMTSYDRHYDSPQTNKQTQQSLQSLFYKSGVTIFQKRMNWMSQPSKDPKVFFKKTKYEKVQKLRLQWLKIQKNKEKDQQELRQFVEMKLKDDDDCSQQQLQLCLMYHFNQFADLGKNLRKSMKSSIDWSQIQKLLQKQYNKTSQLIKQWLRYHSNGEYKPQTVQYRFKTAQISPPQQSSGVGTGLSIFGGAIGVGTSIGMIAAQSVVIAQVASTVVAVGSGWVIGGTTVAATGVAAQAGFTAAIIGGATIGTGLGIALAATGIGAGVLAAGYGGWRLYKYFSRKDQTPLQDLASLPQAQLKEKLEKRAYQMAKYICYDSIKQKTLFTNTNQLSIINQQWLTNASIKEPKALQFEQDKKTNLKKLKLKSKTLYSIQYKVRLPSEQRTMQIIYEAAQKTFYK